MTGKKAGQFLGSIRTPAAYDQERNDEEVMLSFTGIDYIVVLFEDDQVKVYLLQEHLPFFLFPREKQN